MRGFWTTLEEAEDYLRSYGVADEIIAKNFYMVPEGMDSKNVTPGGYIVCLVGSPVAGENQQDGFQGSGPAESACRIVRLERDEGSHDVENSG